MENSALDNLRNAIAKRAEARERVRSEASKQVGTDQPDHALTQACRDLVRLSDLVKGLWYAADCPSVEVVEAA